MATNRDSTISYPNDPKAAAKGYSSIDTSSGVSINLYSLTVRGAASLEAALQINTDFAKDYMSVFGKDFDVASHRYTEKTLERFVELPTVEAQQVGQRYEYYTNYFTYSYQKMVKADKLSLGFLSIDNGETWFLRGKDPRKTFSNPEEYFNNYVADKINAADKYCKEKEGVTFVEEQFDREAFMNRG